MAADYKLSTKSLLCEGLERKSEAPTVTNGVTQASEENTQRQNPTSRTATLTVTIETEGDNVKFNTRLEVGEDVIINHDVTVSETP